MADSNAGDDSGWIDEIISEELPQHHDPVLQQYHKARNSLIAEEKKQRSGTLYFRLTLFFNQDPKAVRDY